MILSGISFSSCCGTSLWFLVSEKVFWTTLCSLHLSSPLVTRYSSLSTRHSPLILMRRHERIIHHSSLAIRHSQLVTQNSFLGGEMKELFITRHSPLATRHSPLAQFLPIVVTSCQGLKRDIFVEDIFVWTFCGWDNNLGTNL